MKLVGLLLLEEFKQAHADARGPLDSWRSNVERVHWDGPHDIKKEYPSASILGDKKIIFNIKGNKYRLVVKVKYQNGIVMIEWVGTHAEYSKQNFT